MVETNDELVPAGSVISERWKILRKCGGGGFGEIYEAHDVKNDQKVAIKVESATQARQVSKIEIAVLKKLQGKAHFCCLLDYGKTSQFNFIVMTLQSRNLSDIRRSLPRGCFTNSTTIRLARQILSAIESIHNVGFLHRDIKPSNFALGNESGNGLSGSRNVVMLDFGLSRPFLTLNGQVRPPRTIAGFRGTVRYASVNAHLSRELGRQDDLWSFFYMLVELIFGTLPWQRIKDRDQVGNIKQNFDYNEFLRLLPAEFSDLFTYIRRLTYFDTPNYQYLQSLFSNYIIRNSIRENDPFDWELPLVQQVQSTVDRHRHDFDVNMPLFHSSQGNLASYIERPRLPVPNLAGCFYTRVRDFVNASSNPIMASINDENIYNDKFTDVFRRSLLEHDCIQVTSDAPNKREVDSHDPDHIFETPRDSNYLRKSPYYYASTGNVKSTPKIVKEHKAVLKHKDSLKTSAQNRKDICAKHGRPNSIDLFCSDADNNVMNSTWHLIPFSSAVNINTRDNSDSLIKIIKGNCYDPSLTHAIATTFGQVDNSNCPDMTRDIPLTNGSQWIAGDEDSEKEIQLIQPFQHQNEPIKIVNIENYPSPALRESNPTTNSTNLTMNCDLLEGANQWKFPCQDESSKELCLNVKVEQISPVPLQVGSILKDDTKISGVSSFSRLFKSRNSQNLSQSGVGRKLHAISNGRAIHPGVSVKGKETSVTLNDLPSSSPISFRTTSRNPTVCNNVSSSLIVETPGSDSGYTSVRNPDIQNYQYGQLSTCLSASFVPTIKYNSKQIFSVQESPKPKPNHFFPQSRLPNRTKQSRRDFEIQQLMRSKPVDIFEKKHDDFIRTSTPSRFVSDTRTSNSFLHAPPNIHIANSERDTEEPYFVQHLNLSLSSNQIDRSTSQKIPFSLTNDNPLRKDFYRKRPPLIKASFRGARVYSETSLNVANIADKYPAEVHLNDENNNENIFPFYDS